MNLKKRCLSIYILSLELFNIQSVNISCSFKYIFIFFIICCKNEDPVQIVEEITINEDLPQEKFSDKLKITGILPLDTNGMNHLGQINDLEWRGNDIIAVENLSAIEKIFIFNSGTGKFKNRISRLGEGPAEFTGLRDIALDGNKIRALVAGKMAFLDYDLNGNCLANIRNNIFGDKLELLENGDFVVYNENNSTDESGLNHLLIYNNEGTKLKYKLFPYLKARDGMGFLYTGFLAKAGDGVYFTPPFSDTLYRVGSKGFAPAYHFNFVDAVIPEDLRKSEAVLTGATMTKYGYLDEGIVKIKNSIIFKFMYKNRFSYGIYNADTKRLISGLHDKGEDIVTHLITWSSGIKQKDENTFVAILGPENVEYFRNDKRFTPDDWNKLHPDLYDTFKSISFKSNPVLIYFQFKS